MKYPRTLGLAIAALSFVMTASANAQNQTGQTPSPGDQNPALATPQVQRYEQPVPKRPRNNDQRFLEAVASERTTVALAKPLRAPDRMVIEGSVIEAVLETAIVSELPGTIRAIVQRDVRSFDGRNVLIPKGSRIVGEYNSGTKLGQNRILIVWNRIVTPDYLDMQVGSLGVDRLGRSGATGYVDTHFVERFGSAALISLIGAIPVVAAGQADNEASEDLAEDVTSDFRRATSGTLDKYLTRPPTIYVDQGAVVSVMLRRDLLFPVVR